MDRNQAELKEKFKKQEIGYSAADKAASLPPESQRELAKKERISIKDVQKKEKSEADIQEDEPEENGQQDIPEEMLPGNWHQAINGHAKTPEAPVKTGHVLRVGPEEYDRVIRGEKAYKLTKNDQKFSEGHDLELWCYKDGKFTGRKAETIISYMDEDIAGLKDGYCILGFQLMSWSE